MTTSSARGRAVAALTIVVAAVGGCIATPGGRPDDTTDPLAGRVCPAGEPHLVIGLTATTWDGGSVVVRRDRDLRPCRGVMFDREDGALLSVAGTSSGRDLLGFDTGRVVLVEAARAVWSFEHEGYGMSAGAVFTTRYQDREVAGVVWFGSSGGESIDLLDLDGGERLEHYDISSSVIGAAPATDGSSNRIAGLIDWEGVQEYRTEPGAASLGTTGERQIPTPRAGELQTVAVHEDGAVIAAADGVLWWPRDRSRAFLGPTACLWNVRGGPVPDGGERYVAAVQDLDEGEHFLAAANGTMQGADDVGSYLFRLDGRGECELLLTADGEHRFSSLAWSGL